MKDPFTANIVSIPKIKNGFKIEFGGQSKVHHICRTSFQLVSEEND